MSRKSNILNDWLKDTGANVKDNLNKTGDTLKDVSSKAGKAAIEFAADAKVTLKDASNKVQQAQHDLKIELDKNKYCPITAEIYTSGDFVLPKIIQVLESDIHSNLEACKGAIGYLPTIAKNKIFQIVKKNCGTSGITFVPNENGVIYIRNPYISNMYINIEDYFDFIKKERIVELEKIANKLGAKKINTEIKEEKKVFVKVNGKKSQKDKVDLEGVKTSEGSSCEAEVSLNKYKTIEIVSDHEFQGGDPERLELVYYKNDSDINALIEMRLGKNPSKEKTFMLKFCSSADININEAMNIDAVLSKLSLSENASIKSEVENEKRLFFQYHIEF